MRIATYTRISTDEAHQPSSLEAQAQRLAAYAQSQEGWTITRRFTDQMSGATLERPGLQRALAESAAKRFDLLLVYRVDRLSRSVRGLAQILEALDQAGVLFRSATEPFDTASSAGRMMVQMLGVFAEFERATIIERVIAGMERNAARGEWTAGQLPFGYQRDEERRFLVPDPAEAPIVAEVFARYTQRLEGSAALANWLSERGYRTKQGRPFTGNAILTMLRNRVYLGEVFFRGQRHPAPHEPLIDRELFHRAQQILAQRGEDASQRRSNQSDYLLTGLITCAGCGKRYIGCRRARQRRTLHLLRVLHPPALRQRPLRRRPAPRPSTRRRDPRPPRRHPRPRTPHPPSDPRRLQRARRRPAQTRSRDQAHGR